MTDDPVKRRYNIDDYPPQPWVHLPGCPLQGVPHAFSSCCCEAEMKNPDDPVKRARELLARKDPGATWPDRELTDREIAFLEEAPELLAQLADRVEAAERERDKAWAFLRRTAMGGSVVSSAAMTETQIAIARAANRLLVTPGGYGFVHVPPADSVDDLTRERDEARAEVERLTHCDCGQKIPRGQCRHCDNDE